MIIKGNIYGTDRQFHTGTVVTDNDLIIDVSLDNQGCTLDVSDSNYIDASNKYVIPGLIDIHLHGAMDFDIGDATYEAIDKIARFELSQGVTSFVGATMTMPVDNIIEVISTARDYMAHNQGSSSSNDLSTLIGLNVEGPFISPDKCGAQNKSHILPPDLELAKEFIKTGDGIVKILGLAPELCSDLSIIKTLSESVKVAITHSNSDYETAIKALNMGASHVTHFFNGMTSFTHRSPGIFGALVDSNDITIELITDGIHVHPTAVNMAYKLFSDKSLIMISDSMRGCGLGDGIYTLGDLDIEVKNHRATLKGTNNPAGSVSSLYDNIKATHNRGLPLESIIAMATINPARCVGVEDEIGSIEAGKKADILILDKELSIDTIIKNGIPLQ